MRRIEWLKRAQRNIAITTDIIVGFPGETEEDFHQTLAVGRGPIRFAVHFQVLSSPQHRSLTV